VFVKPTIPSAVVNVRREICARCEIQCAEFLAGRIDAADPCAECPAKRKRWMRYGACEQFATNRTPTNYLPEIRQGIGLGDAVAMVAQPIAGAIDALLGTNVRGCGGCKQRQAALNALVPDLGLSLKPRPENDKPPQR